MKNKMDRKDSFVEGIKNALVLVLLLLVTFALLEIPKKYYQNEDQELFSQVKTVEYSVNDMEEQMNLKQKLETFSVHGNICVTEPDPFIRNYLPCENFWKEDGKIYGPNPKECFAGNPYEAGSLGCFAGVIEKSLKDMKKANYPGMENIRIENVSGMELRELAETYISRKIPVIVWITIDMEPSYEGMEYYLEDGSLYVWRAREHCMVLCGFDRNQYYLMDPLSDGRMVSYALETVEARYEELGMQAIVLEPDRNET